MAAAGSVLIGGGKETIGMHKAGGFKNYSADYEAEIQTSEKWKRPKVASKEKGVKADTDFLRAMNAWNDLEAERRAFESEIRRMERSGNYAKDEISDAVNAFEAKQAKELKAWTERHGKAFEEADALLNPKAEGEAPPEAGRVKNPIAKAQAEAVVDETARGGYNADDEFGRIQEESREQLGKPRGERVYPKDNEGLRLRLSDVFGRELERRGIDARSHRILHLENDFDLYDGIDGKTFHDVFEVAKKYTYNGELVDLHDDYSDATPFLSKDGLSGFAISKDRDLVSVFNANAKRGFLKSIAPIVKDKVATLDCYVSNRQNLQEMYSKVFGFKTAALMDFNYEMLASKKGKAYADWFVSTYGEAPVAFMVNTDEDVETKRFGKGQYYEAKAYQLSYAKKKAAPVNYETEEGDKPIHIKVKKQDFQVENIEQADYFSNNSLVPFEDAFKNHVNAETTKFIKTGEELRSYIKKHIDGKGNQRAFLGKLSETTVADIKKETGLESMPDSLGVTIDPSALKHIYNEHINEFSPKPNLITEKEISLLPKIIGEYDSVEKRTVGNTIFLKFKKEIDGNYVAVLSYSKKRKSLALKTFYQTKKSAEISIPTGSAANATETTTFETTGVSSDGFTNNIQSDPTLVKTGSKPSIEDEVSKRYGKDHASAPASMVIEASNAKDGKVATKRSVLDMRKVVDEAVDDILSRGNIPGQKTESKSLSPADTQDLFAKINLADESRMGEIKAKAFEKIEDLEVIYKDDVDGVRETYALKDLLDENERAELRERFDEAFSDMLSRRKDSRLREFADRVSRLIEENSKVRERARIAAKTRDAFDSLSNKLGIQGKESKLKTVLKNGSEADTDAISLFREVVKDTKISSKTGLSTSPKAANRLIEFNGKYTYEKFGDSALWDPEIKNELNAIEQLSENGRYRENMELGIEAQRHALNLLKAINHRLNAETAQRVEANRAKARESAVAADMLAPSEGRYLGTMADKAENLPQYLSNHLGKENPLYAAVVEGWTKANGTKLGFRQKYAKATEAFLKQEGSQPKKGFFVSREENRGARTHGRRGEKIRYRPRDFEGGNQRKTSRNRG